LTIAAVIGPVPAPSSTIVRVFVQSIPSRNLAGHEPRTRRDRRDPLPLRGNAFTISHQSGPFGVRTFDGGFGLVLAAVAGVSVGGVAGAVAGCGVRSMASFARSGGLRQDEFCP